MSGGTWSGVSDPWTGDWRKSDLFKIFRMMTGSECEGEENNNGVGVPACHPANLISEHSLDIVK